MTDPKIDQVLKVWDNDKGIGKLALKVVQDSIVYMKNIYVDKLF